MADENAPSPRTVLGRSKIFTPEVQKFVCGKVLYNYDNLEPAERKLVL